MSRYLNTNLVRSLIIALLFAAAPALVADDAPGTLEFKAHNQIYNAQGSFKKWHFTKVDIPDGDFEKATVEFEVDLGSVWEKAADLISHLLTPDFLDVKKYTTATVKIDRAEKTGDDTYEAVATVSLHGVTVEVPIEFKVVGSSPLEIEGTATLSRTAFDVGEPYQAGNDKSILDGVAITLKAKVQ